MPRRKIVLATQEIYHVVNRSIAKIPIFEQPRDYQRAILESKPMSNSSMFQDIFI